MPQSVRLNAAAADALEAAAAQSGVSPAAVASAAIVAALRPDDEQAAQRLAGLLAGQGDTGMTPEKVAEAVTAALGFVPPAAVMTLGRVAHLDEPDDDLGGRTFYGWSSTATPQQAAWSTAGRWRMPKDFRPAWCVGVAQGAHRALLATPVDGWRTGDDGRWFHPDPWLVTPGGRQRLTTGDTADLTEVDRVLLEAISAPWADLPTAQPVKPIR